MDEAEGLRPFSAAALHAAAAIAEIVLLQKFEILKEKTFDKTREAAAARAMRIDDIHKAIATPAAAAAAGNFFPKALQLQHRFKAKL